ncbi:MAG: hypothetical protein JW918_12605 [Anaerolineae bacterium]|nr:hypothetical protein [Anaerolineae bacterium]
MKDCLTASTENAPLNPTKRVNYNFGMVLGVDDFRQEQAHFEWKHRISNLLLHGFGTVCGLQVTAEAVTDPSDVLIRVSAGYGISREGKWMWVDRDLCARLGEWLEAHGGDLSPAVGAGRHTVYVTLCYAECPTDLVPIAGQPCASDEDTRAPSRIQEAYQVEFSWEMPDQPAEDAVRVFGNLMAQVEIVPDETSPPVDDGERLLAAVQTLAEVGTDAILASPPLSSPPAVDMIPFQLPASTACDTIRQALVVWVTEVCPRLHAPLKPGEKDCILLACIDFDVDVNGELDYSLDPEGDLLPGSVEVDSCTRPVLVPDRLKQELFCFGGAGGGVGPTGPQGPIGPMGPAGPAGPPGPAIAVTGSEDVLVGPLVLNPLGTAGDSILSDPIDHGLDGNAPLILAVQRITTDAPPGEFVNVVVTPYREPGSTEFRIGATNLSSRTVSSLRVRWWALTTRNRRGPG